MLLRDKVESTTNPEARLYKKAKADKAVPAYQGHALIENRNGLVVAAEATEAATVAERAAALLMNERCNRSRSARLEKRRRWKPARFTRTRSSSSRCANTESRR